MKGKILVTGVNGFVGHHVANELNKLGYKILGAGLQPELEDNLTEIVDDYISCDLTRTDQIKKIDLKSLIAIVNLAGFAKVGDSKGKGELYNKVNVGVHTVLYEECIAQGATPRIIAISSGAVYDPSQTLPITEDSKLIDDNKTNEYVVSKKLMEQAVLKFNDRGLDCIVVRPFNHSGPGQLPGFLLPDLGEQIVAAREKNQPLLVGNLNTRRDYTDVRDVARAYALLATIERSKLHHTIYNICSGTSTPGTKILGLLKEAFQVPELQTEIDHSRIRANEIMDIYGSRDKITADTGWQPKISVEKMVVDYAEWKKSH